MDNKTPKTKPQRRRSRKVDGTFEGGSQAFEATDVTAALPKEPNEKYSLRKKVDGISNDTSGKYGKKPKVTRPGFGNTTVTLH